MVRLINKKMCAMPRHTVLDWCGTLARDAAGCDDDITTAKHLVNLSGVTGNVLKSADDRALRSLLEDRASRFFENTESEEFLGYLSPKGVCRYYNKYFGTCCRNQDGKHCLGLAGTRGH